MPYLSNLVKKARKLDQRWQRSIRPNERTVLVNARTAMNYATLAPIVERLQHDSRIHLFFTASESAEKAAEIFSAAKPPYRLIHPSSAASRHFDIYLAADFLWVTLPRGTTRIQTFHGVAGKYRTIYDSPATSMREWDKFFFINKRRMQHFIDCGAIDPDSSAACLIGMPKLDCLVDGSLSRNEVLTSFGLDPSKRTILYAPTWSPYSSVCFMGEDLVRRLGDAGYTVMVKLHDRSLDTLYANSGGVNWGERLQPVVQSVNGLIAGDSNSSPYLAAADLLITDHSSVGFEFMVLDRPVVRINVPELIAKTDIEPFYVEMMKSASFNCTTVDDVMNAIQHAFSEPELLSEARKLVGNELFYKPGTATMRAINEIYRIFNLSLPSPSAVAVE